MLPKSHIQPKPLNVKPVESPRDYSWIDYGLYICLLLFPFYEIHVPNLPQLSYKHATVFLKADHINNNKYSQNLLDEKIKKERSTDTSQHKNLIVYVTKPISMQE